MSAGSGTGEASASGEVEEEGVALSDSVEDAGALAAAREAAFKDREAGIKAQGWHLKQATLSKLAYVSLEMEDPVAALGACRQLLAEYCPANMPVIFVNEMGEVVMERTVGQMLPEPFVLNQ